MFTPEKIYPRILYQKETVSLLDVTLLRIEKMNFEIYESMSFAELESVLAKYDLDLIILNYQLSNTDFQTWVKNFRERIQKNHVPILFLTSCEILHHADALTAWVNRILRTPVTKEELLFEIEGLID